jgi:hypothetical protein
LSLKRALSISWSSTIWQNLPKTKHGAIDRVQNT